MFLLVNQCPELVPCYELPVDHATKQRVTCQNIVNFLNIRTPKIFVVITLKFELCGSTIE